MDAQRALVKEAIEGGKKDASIVVPWTAPHNGTQEIPEYSPEEEEEFWKKGMAKETKKRSFADVVDDAIKKFGGDQDDDDDDDDDDDGDIETKVKKAPSAATLYKNRMEARQKRVAFKVMMALNKYRTENGRNPPDEWYEKTNQKVTEEVMETCYKYDEKQKSNPDHGRRPVATGATPAAEQAKAAVGRPVTNTAEARAALKSVYSFLQSINKD